MDKSRVIAMKLIYNSSLAKLLCSLLIIFLCRASLHAQSLKLAGFDVTYFQDSEIENRISNQKAGLFEYNFFLNLPAQFRNEKTILVNGLQYKLVTPSIENNAIEALDDQNLHLIGYSLTILHELANDWRFIGVANPVISSTLNSQLERDDLIFNGVVQFMKMHSENLNYGLGIARTAKLGDPVFLPVLQLGLTSGKNNLQIALPRSVSYEYTFGDLMAGLQLSLDGSQYNATYSASDQIGTSEPVDIFAYTRLLIGPTLKYRVGKLIQLETSAGFVTARSIEVKSDLIEDEKFDIANSSFLKFGISIVPPR